MLLVLTPIQSPYVYRLRCKAGRRDNDWLISQQRKVDFSPYLKVDFSPYLRVSDCFLAGPMAYWTSVMRGVVLEEDGYEGISCPLWIAGSWGRTYRVPGKLIKPYRLGVIRI